MTHQPNRQDEGNSQGSTGTGVGSGGEQGRGGVRFLPAEQPPIPFALRSYYTRGKNAPNEQTAKTQAGMIRKQNPDAAKAMLDGFYANHPVITPKYPEWYTKTAPAPSVAASAASTATVPLPSRPVVSTEPYKAMLDRVTNNLKIIGDGIRALQSNKPVDVSGLKLNEERGPVETTTSAGLPDFPANVPLAPEKRFLSRHPFVAPTQQNGKESTMGLFDGLFGSKKRQTVDSDLQNTIDYLKAIQLLHPDAYLCLESKPLGSSPLLPAAVLLDTYNDVGVCFVKTDLSWLSGLKVVSIEVQPWIEEKRWEPPLIIVHKEVMDEQHQFTAARILLQKHDGTATYIAFPWMPKHLNMITPISRWIFWSSLNELRGDGTHYWGFGDFGNQDTFEEFITRVANGSQQIRR